MEEKINVLFVCTGNIFRSMSAEYCLKKYLKDNNINRINVSSAGTIAKIQMPDTKTIEELKKNKIDISKHRQRKLTKKILQEQDVVIAMAKSHQEFIVKNFNVYPILFNELAQNKSNSVDDIDDVILDYKTNRNAVEKHIAKTINHIHNSTKTICKELILRNFLFLDLVNKKIKYRNNNTPFISLYETKYSIAFLSIDIPKYEDGHILIIPKKRYKYLEQIPQHILNDLIKSMGIVGTALKKYHGGYNVLLNCGSVAGQYIFHTHFHIIPRNPKDNIKIEIWKRKKYSKKDFLKYNEKIKKEINAVLSNNNSDKFITANN